MEQAHARQTMCFSFTFRVAVSKLEVLKRLPFYKFFFFRIMGKAFPKLQFLGKVRGSIIQEGNYDKMAAAYSCALFPDGIGCVPDLLL
jgi:hypothetical protein